jgi:plasmid replication initiation protein
MNKDVIKALRKMFKNPNTREKLMTLMVEEIRYEKMVEKQHKISYMEAIETLREEFNDMAYSIESQEKSIIVGKFMKDIGL